MENKKKLYPLEFISETVAKPWGEESWDIADLGFADSVVKKGWLEGNSIGDIMETYLERISGEAVYQYYGRQFPVMIKRLSVNGKTSVQTNPDDEAAEQRYDALGKVKMWYITDTSEDARIYLGFRNEISAQALYEKCLDGSIISEMNEVKPHKGDAILFRPGIVHCAAGKIQATEIQESSDLTFRLYDWGRENSEDTARPMHLEEAFDLIDLGKCDPSVYIKTAEEGNLFTCKEFCVNLMKVSRPLQIGHPGYFLIYTCINGELSLQVAAGEGKEKKTEEYRLKKGESILIPGDMSDFYLVPVDTDTVLMEVMPGENNEPDEYIDPNTEPFLEGEDYEGLEDDDTEDGENDSERL